MTTLGQTYTAAAVVSIGIKEAESMIRQDLAGAAHRDGVILGTVRWENRMHKDFGPCIAGMADVVAYAKTEPGVVADLDKVDLGILRAITRQAHLDQYPTLMCEVCAGTKRDGYGETCGGCEGRGHVPSKPLTDAECDAIINGIAPDTAHKLVKKAVDSGAVH